MPSPLWIVVANGSRARVLQRHAPAEGLTELRAWVRALGGPVQRAFVVHGEAGPAAAMAQILKEEGVRQVVIPELGESFDL